MIRAVDDCVAVDDDEFGHKNHVTRNTYHVSANWPFGCYVFRDTCYVIYILRPIGFFINQKTPLREL